MTNNNEWLKSLSHEEAKEAERGLVAGRKWGESRPYDAVKAVVKFAAVAFSPANPADLWDGDHDAAYDHYALLKYEAVGEDDEDFNNAMEADWGDPFQMGWYFGVGEAFAAQVLNYNNEAR